MKLYIGLIFPKYNVNQQGGVYGVLLQNAGRLINIL